MLFDADAATKNVTMVFAAAAVIIALTVSALLEADGLLTHEPKPEYHLTSKYDREGRLFTKKPASIILDYSPTLSR